MRHNPAKIYGAANAGVRPKSAAAKLSELREKQRKERMEREKVRHDFTLGAVLICRRGLIECRTSLNNCHKFCELSHGEWLITLPHLFTVHFAGESIILMLIIMKLLSSACL